MKTLTPSQIDEVEKSLGVTLPAFYRKLLVEVGHGRLPLGRQIYHPAEIGALYGSLFHGPSKLFHPYVPFGCDDRLQIMWVIDCNLKQVASIWHETEPADWPAEAWLDYAEWTIHYLESKD